MKKLPKVYQNEFSKKITNNKTVCYLKEEKEGLRSLKSSNTTVEDQLNTIFNGIGYSYNIPVIIKTSNKVYETSLVAKTKNNVVTLDNEVIPISDILDIIIAK